MSKIIRRLAFLLLALAVVLLASCALQAHSRTQALATISVGDTEQSVLARLGQPSKLESPDQPYLLYATSGCIAPCAKRLWWEWPLFRGIEAWSVELDSSHRVVETSHWVSP